MLADPGAPGTRALLGHVEALAGHGVDGELVVAGPDPGPALAAGLPRREPGAGGPAPDLALALDWTALETALGLGAARCALALHDLEDRRAPAGSSQRGAAALALDLPIGFLATRPHVATALRELRPDAPVAAARLGLEQPPVAAAEAHGGPLRVLALGPGAAAALAAMRQRAEPLAGAGADSGGPAALRERAAAADVVVRLEPSGEPLGPLPAFAAGATAIAADEPAIAEHLEHGVSGLVVDPDDRRGAARALDLLARDGQRLAALRAGALAAARGWPSAAEAAGELAGALGALAEAPVPDPALSAARLVGDLRAGLELQRGIERERDALRARVERIERLARRPGLGPAVRLAERLLR